MENKENNSVNDKVLNDFIEMYKNLSEKEKFAVGSLFKKATGGDLSPYDSPKPVAVSLIQVQDGDEIKLLGTIRGIAPKIGEIAFPGGFVNKGEELLSALVRETDEEASLLTDTANYTYLMSKTTPGNQMLHFFVDKTIYPIEMLSTLKCEPDAKGVQECLGFELITKDTPMAFPLHKEAALMFFSLQNNNDNKATTRLKM